MKVFIDNNMKVVHTTERSQTVLGEVKQDYNTKTYHFKKRPFTSLSQALQEEICWVMDELNK